MWSDLKIENLYSDMNSPEISKILITGASGMVGKNILEHPKSSNYTILTPSSSELNLRNYEQTLKYLRQHNPDFIIHAAGLVGGIQANIKRPVDFLVYNTDMGRNLLMAGQQANINRILNLSSSCMYPKEGINPLQETMVLSGALEPTNEGYALAKIFTSKLCEYLNRENPKLEYKTAIPCNLYGRFDKFSPEHSHMVPAVIKKIYDAKINNLKEIDIWGDGMARREFMYAGDLADFIFYAIDKFEDMPQNLNVGLGIDFSINEYYKTIAEAIGYNGAFVHDLSKPIGMKQKLIDNSKLKAFGWQPKTKLKDGILKTIEYYKSTIHD
jgi:nucleoside-diphosphate-sugar epimerase